MNAKLFEPLLSEETMYYHYDKLYKNYVNQFQKLVDSNITPLEAVKNISSFPLDKRGNILHNAGGILNHELYFEEIDKNGRHIPSGILIEDIMKKYGSYENFKKEFIKIAKLLVGSGYTFLVLNSQNELDIVNMSNQETPYLYDMIPIMNIDLWEHAYYLDYKNEKNKYIDIFFDLINYDVIDKRYEQAKATQN
ncbi:MAG: superoxide dismutase [Bacilli bacterium]|nr:superoxide dismutase [Bacilli bacterium]